MKTVSLYIHIPFCYRKCLYCDFLSFDHQVQSMTPYMNALKTEIKNYSPLIKDYSIKSIFIGGGTPSILSVQNIVELFEPIHLLNITPETEITIECNPGTIDKEKVQIYKQTGINRISFGLQSCNNRLLKKLGRIHTYEEFLSSYQLVRDHGFENVNVDLMFGLPDQTIEDWNVTLKTIIPLEPEHISAYSLIIEEDTPFSRMQEKRQLQLPNEHIEREMYWLTHHRLYDAGYKHYEISNYSKPSYPSIHNTVYWQVEPYIGAGLGAASLFNEKRYSNIKNMKSYIEAMGKLELIRENVQPVTRESNIEEYMFLGLRMLDGVSKKEFYKRFNMSMDHYYGHVIDMLVTKGLLETDKDNVKLTHKGLDVSNYVFKEFIL